MEIVRFPPYINMKTQNLTKIMKNNTNVRIFVWFIENTIRLCYSKNNREMEVQLCDQILQTE